MTNPSPQVGQTWQDWSSRYRPRGGRIFIIDEVGPERVTVRCPITKVRNSIAIRRLRRPSQYKFLR